jgi:hypothetical protein
LWQIFPIDDGAQDTGCQWLYLSFFSTNFLDCDWNDKYFVCYQNKDFLCSQIFKTVHGKIKFISFSYGFICLRFWFSRFSLLLFFYADLKNNISMLAGRMPKRNKLTFWDNYADDGKFVRSLSFFFFHSIWNRKICI